MSADHIDSARMADLARDPVIWPDAEAAHLAGCADCRLEFEIIAAARRIGAAQLAGFDPARVAAGVRHRLAAAPVEAPVRAARHPRRWLAGLAAAAVVVLAVRTVIPKGRGRPAQAGRPATAVVSVLPELDGLSAPQLEEVLQSIPPATEALDHVEVAPLTVLSASDLERMLRSMED